LVAIEATLAAVNQALEKHHTDTRTRLAGAA
ncbi:iron-sulfur cluster assembly scaffold protein, partial [Escherichia coli]|nr:iron-sulfur cluster assembly scaffold protein [Escherichia coli]